MKPTAPAAQEASEAIDLSVVDEIVERIGRGRESTIPILQAIQDRFRYLPKAALRRVCEITDITPAAITSVATFYTQFRDHPVGEHVISVCHGTACHVKGAQNITDALYRVLNIPEGDDTDPEGRFTVEKVACLGCCTLAPVMQIDGVTFGRLRPDTIAKAIEDFLAMERSGLLDQVRQAQESPDAEVAEIRVGLGSCCQAGGSARVHQALIDVVRENGAAAVVKRVGCVGMCHRTPLVEIAKPGAEPVFYANVQPEDAEQIVARHFPPPSIVKRARLGISRLLDKLLTDKAWDGSKTLSLSLRDGPVSAFLGRQKRIAVEDCGEIDPTDIDEYMAHEGFRAVERCLAKMSPEEVVDWIQRSQLRGRGGAGFPVGRKWSLVRAAEGDKKYVVCNGDEGDPGAFMDRMILESFPYRVLEGMIIAAYAVGADEGYLYIRHEYPLAVARVREALEQCEKRGLLGERILGTNFSLRLRVMEGAGAFVCGEETALLASIEGRRGMPRLRPPYPANKGLWGNPTLINNVETFSVVPWIVRNGPEAFAAVGTESSKGTKVFALAGKIARGGLIEVPMGITIREIVEEIGGGIAGGKRFKAVQIGGPSGGCVPARLADTPVDYEALQEVGAIMGSGGLVVLDETDCMVDIARYFLEFTQNQSCGRCTFCRVGTRRMLDILEKLCSGEGQMSDLDELEELAILTKRASICGLGQTAPNPVLTTLQYFREEYVAHVEGRCPAGKCKALIHYTITDDCIGCTLCAQHCPSQAIEMKPYEKHEIDQEKCVRCGGCKGICPVDAVQVE